MENLNQEIERKYMVKELPKMEEIERRELIEQTYLGLKPQLRVRRVTCIGTGEVKHLMTVKSSSNKDGVRVEIENEIDEKSYMTLLKDSISETLIKERSYTKSGVEIDRYPQYNLYTCEKEFSSIEDMKAYVPEKWMGEDITNDKNFSNLNLAKVVREEKEQKNKSKKDKSFKEGKKSKKDDVIKLKDQKKKSE